MTLIRTGRTGRTLSATFWSGGTAGRRTHSRSRCVGEARALELGRIPFRSESASVTFRAGALACLWGRQAPSRSAVTEARWDKVAKFTSPTSEPQSSLAEGRQFDPVPDHQHLAEIIGPFTCAKRRKRVIPMALSALDLKFSDLRKR